MGMIGVLGGMGPAATADFMDKLVRATPARRDQSHIPVLVASFPHVPDRSAAILGHGPDPLPALLRGMDLLNDAGVGVVAIACNSAHHWWDAISARSRAPVLHIARACVRHLQAQAGARVLLLGTRGMLASGFHQRALAKAGFDVMLPDAQEGQARVDDCIARVKAGEPEAGGMALAQVLRTARGQGADVALMACTEIPIAAQHCAECAACGVILADSAQALADEAVAYAMLRGWHRYTQAEAAP